MPGIAAVDALEVPRARDDFRVRFPRARPRLERKERFHIDLPAAENRALDMGSQPCEYGQPYHEDND